MENRKIIVLGEGCEGCGGGYDVATGEHLELYQLCSEGNHKVEVRLAAGARAKMVFVAAPQGEIDYDYRIELNGEGAEVELYGVFVTRGESRARIHTEMRHNAPRCRSNQQVRGVADESGYGLFDGLVYVAPDAQQTEAYQQSRNVLLSPTARIQTQPQLEIYADDVKCSHGATVGQMNEEEIYYMRQRGLSEEDARRLQLGGFVQEIVDKVSDEALREKFERVVGL
jgi:Fe-S cluster assembly protein SufD